MPIFDQDFEPPIIQDAVGVDGTDIYVTPDMPPDAGGRDDTSAMDTDSADVFLFIDYFPPSGTSSSTGPDPEPLADEEPEKPDFPTETELFDRPGRHSAIKAMLLRTLVFGD